MNNDTDVYIARSVNQGAAWTLIPVVGNVGSVTEFMPAVDVDQSSGSVNVMYYSTLGDTGSGNDDVNVMVASSIDAGSTYAINQQLTTATSRASAITGNNDFLDYNGLAVLDGTVQAMWCDNRGATSDAEAFTTSASFSSATNGNVLNVSGTAGSDTIIIRRNAANHSFIEVVVNGVTQYAGLIATLDSAGVLGHAGSDLLTINNANGIVNLPFNYDGGTSILDNDRLAITGNPGSPVARETYLVGATEDAGTWVLDPDGNQGPGVTLAGNGDELTITFLNLEPVDSDTPAVIFDTIMNTMPNDATIQNGGLLNGANSLQVTDNNSTFETFRFANKGTVRIMGSSGADTITVDFTTAAAGLTNLEIYGHLAFDVPGPPADDNAADNLKVFRNAPGVTYILFGQGGNDNFIVGNGDLSLILASVAAVGGDGTDGITVDDSGRNIPVNYLIDPGQITIRTSLAPPADFQITHYDGTMENVQLDGTQAPNQFDVVPSIFAVYFVNGHLPTSAGPGADILVLHTAGTTGRVLTYNPVTGNGNWMFAPPTKTVNFTSIEQLKFAPMLVYSADAAKNGKPTVKVVDADTGALITSFQAYEATYKEGVRVAVGDINGDGIPEIITAPGHNHTALIEVWDITSADLTTPPTLLESFLAYPSSYKGGSTIGIGDVNGDKLNDLVVAPSRGQANIHTYINQGGANAVGHRSPTQFPGVQKSLCRRRFRGRRRCRRRRQCRNHRRLRRRHARYRARVQRRHQRPADRRRPAAPYHSPVPKQRPRRSVRLHGQYRRRSVSGNRRRRRHRRRLATGHLRHHQPHHAGEHIHSLQWQRQQRPAARCRRQPNRSRSATSSASSPYPKAPTASAKKSAACHLPDPRSISSWKTTSNSATACSSPPAFSSASWRHR